MRRSDARYEGPERLLAQAKKELHGLVGDGGGPQSRRIEELKQVIRGLQLRLRKPLTVSEAR